MAGKKSLLDKLMEKIANDNSGSLTFLKSTVKNWHSFLLFLLGLWAEVTVKMRNGKEYKLKNIKNYVTFYYYGKEIRLFYSTKMQFVHTALMVVGEFLDEPHAGLNVKDKDVVDVGAYVADSAIYFAVKGAKKVYAFEPYPLSYYVARKNVQSNGLNRKILLFNAAVGKKGTVKVNVDEDSAGSDLREYSKGVRIPVISLDYLVKKYRLKNAALKIDCEGCEYGIIKNAPISILRSFSDILIEYHYGYTELIKKLQKAGFKFKYTMPESQKNMNAKNKDMQMGTIWAHKKNN